MNETLGWVNSPKSRERSILLMISPEERSVNLAVNSLRRLALEVHTAKNAETGVEKLHLLHPDLVLVDSDTGVGEGLDILNKLLIEDPSASVVLASEVDSAEAALAAIRRGARDYIAITKPFDKVAFCNRISNFFDKPKALPLEADAPGNEPEWCGMIGVSEAMRRLFEQIKRFAPHFRSVLIHGETGTGKELVAKAFHLKSERFKKPFVPCNCAAITESLIESELFGHVRGSFTGASQDHEGLIGAAHGGTLFLDEIGELPLQAQAKLLRVLQTGELRPVGSSKVFQVDFRVVAATNRDLRAMVASKRFREDLYYRLSMLELRVPPLRERAGDVSLLLQHFLQRFGEQFGKPGLRASARAVRLLEQYHWPGNVRQLENAIGSAVLMAEGNLIDANHFNLATQDQEEDTWSPEGLEEIQTLDEITSRYARFVLQKVQGNRRKAAMLLGISRATLYRLLREPKEADSEAS